MKITAHRARSRRDRPYPARRAAIPLLFVGAVSSSLAVANDATALQGAWRCSGGNDDVSFTSEWSLEESGEYADVSLVHTRQDIDRDGQPDELELGSTETGTWSLTDEGELRFHVHALEISSMKVNGESLPMASARAIMAQTIAGAAGRVTSVPFELSDEGVLTASIGGLEASCER